MGKPDTIAAIATGSGRGAIGVVRVSGADLRPLLTSLLGAVPAARQATLARFTDRQGHSIDVGLVLYFPAPHSYTGEDVVELQGHGGVAVLRLVLKRCVELGARLAEPGEFSQRAFMNGKLDLAQAEAVADLIEAQSAQAARSAVRSLSGEFSRAVRAVAQAIIEVRMLVEACLDFPEEALDGLSGRAIDSRYSELRTEFEAVVRAAEAGRRLRDGIRIVLCGPPNVGKSSLMNRLVGDDVAIVTDIPGTTRDALREHLEIDGVPVEIVDTAGIRESSDPVEAIGIARAKQAIADADLLLLMEDATAPDLHESAFEPWVGEKTCILKVRNKIDLTGEPSRLDPEGGSTRITVSAKTGAGIDTLKAELLRAAGYRPGFEGVFLARERQLRCLAEAGEHLDRAAAVRPQLELLAEELRLSHVALGKITGEFVADDLLGEIFSRFCIGK